MCEHDSEHVTSGDTFGAGLCASQAKGDCDLSIDGIISDFELSTTLWNFMFPIYFFYLLVIKYKLQTNTKQERSLSNWQLVTEIKPE